jgi:ABC-2 type transport system ATP-binding protein
MHGKSEIKLVKKEYYRTMANENNAILAVNDLHIRYGDRVAVSDVSFVIHPGEIFGLLGPNGAGKTSTLSAIEGLLKPQSGTVHIVGINIADNSLQARANIGVQLQATSFQKDLNVFEIIELYSGLYGVSMDKARLTAIIEDIKLQDDVNKKTGELSGGQQQRVALATATLHNPPLVLLDEPTSGLDPQSRRHLWDRIEKMRDSGRSILLTTHSMEEAAAVCDRVAIMDRGKVIVVGTPSDLIEHYNNDPNVKAVARRGTVTLEDVFIGLTGKEVRD